MATINPESTRERGRRGPAPGSQVDDEMLKRAARAWIDLEETGKLSKSEIGRKIGLKRAPEWLDSQKFRETLELTRFEAQTEKLSGIAGLGSLVDQVIQLGMVEAFRRLKQNPGEIPATVLFGDILTRLVKLRQELDVKKGDAPTASLMITVRQELALIPDPRLRSQVARQIFGQYQQAMDLLSDYLPALSAAGITSTKVAGASSDERPASLEVIDAVVSERSPDGSPPGAEANAASPSPRVRLWSDPVEDLVGGVSKDA